MDKKAKQILMKTFWNSGGWKPGVRTFAGPDFEYARSQGIMFDPITITHDELIQRLDELHKQITLQQVSEAFLHSLSTRNVHLRSVLSSWALTADLPLHTYEQRKSVHVQTSSCGDCNHHRLMSDREVVDGDLNVLNFERIKWGGIRLNWLLYCWLDLELFSREQLVEATEQDVQIFGQMLEAVNQCEPVERARKLEKRWKDLLPSSKHERDVLMEILGYSGVLQTTDLPRIGRGHDTDFMSMAEWQGQDGYNEQAVKHYFAYRGLE